MVVINGIELRYGMKVEIGECISNAVTISDENGDEIYYDTYEGYWVKREFDNKHNVTSFENSYGNWFKKEYDKNGNLIYHKDSKGDWEKREYDNNGKLTYLENSTGFWSKTEYDKQGNKIYQEGSDGLIIDNRPNTITIDGKEIELSKKSYERLKKHFKEEK